MGYSLTNNGSTLAQHSTRAACVIEAFERGLVVRGRGLFLASGVDIVCNENNPKDSK